MPGGFTRRWSACAAIAIQFAAGGGQPASAAESRWSEVPNSARARLVAGTVDEGGSPKPYAFLDIEMAPGWKTYWRNPGDAGGLPPRLDFSKSENLANAIVYFPAPHRYVDKSGNTLGYKERVLFPVDLAAKDPQSPIRLHLEAQYGLCKDVCIPAEAAFDLELPAGATPLPPEALEALSRVPRPAEMAGPGAPRLLRVTSSLEGEKPKIVIEAAFPGGEAGADVFLEAPDSLYVPVPARVGGSGGTLVFEADLTEGADVKALKGKMLLATLVSEAGQSIATFKLE